VAPTDPLLSQGADFADISELSEFQLLAGRKQQRIGGGAGGPSAEEDEMDMLSGLLTSATKSTQIEPIVKKLGDDILEKIVRRPFPRYFFFVLSLFPRSFFHVSPLISRFSWEY